MYPSWGQRFLQSRELARVTSPYQEIIVLETESHGRVLVLDGAVQITERDEFVYQEMLAHVPLLAQGNARRVLIIGAGDGGVLRRVLQHRTVETVVMVEIDAEVIKLAREYLPSISGKAWDDPRAQVIVGDGLAHVAAAADQSFDVIIVDSTDPVGVGEVLFTDAFYRDCARVLGPTGVIVCQAGVPFMQADELVQGHNRRAAAFDHATAYVAAVPTYVGGFMTLAFASNAAGLEKTSVLELQARAEQAGILGTTRYWSPAVHASAFALPPYILDCISGPNGR